MRLVGGEALPLLVLLRLEGGEVPLRVQLEGGEPFPITRTIMLINTNLFMLINKLIGGQEQSQEQSC